MLVDSVLTNVAIANWQSWRDAAKAGRFRFWECVPPVKIAVLVDSMSVTRWQADALRCLGDGIDFMVYNCTNPRPAPRRLRHFAYYLLNVLSLRSDLTRRTKLPDRVSAGPKIDFQYEVEGNWRRFPEWLVEKIKNDQPLAIVKFGLGLLRVPDQLSVPILSYHHGDPRKFRGRPAGFYEILSSAEALGQIVQIIGNRLDAGAVLAFAETRVHRHSYRATMREAYATSRFLLRQAIVALRDGGKLDIHPGGTVYRLPSTAKILRFAAALAEAKIRRIAYGAFVEKEWKVATASPPTVPAPPFHSLLDTSRWREVRRPREYRFLADPFPLADGAGILVEALRTSTGLGEILALGPNGNRKLLGGNRHFSYPATFTTSEGKWLLPEISEWSEPRLYSLGGNGAQEVGKLNLPGPCRLVDPTLFQWHGKIFLFANQLFEGDAILRLWMAQSLRHRFEEHPSSPIRMSPIGGRMGGSIIRTGGSLYRVGQNGAGSYGNGVLFFEIDELSADRYSERLVGSLCFDHYHGPHTLNVDGNSILFDYYRNRFTPLAALRRVRARLARDRDAV